MSKQRNIRKRKALDEQEDLADDDGPNGAPALTTEDIKLLQKERHNRKIGVNAADLVRPTEKVQEQPKEAANEEAADGLQVSFKQEKRRYTEDDDPHMKKYIEQQLARRLGKSVEDDGANADQTTAPKDINEAALQAIDLRQRQVDTEMGSTWIEGVAEVPLDLKHRLKNIEATEAAKAALLSRGGPAGGRKPFGFGDDDDDEQGRAAQLRRSQFPVGFGQRPSWEKERVDAAVERKARAKALAAEKKKKKETEFSGW